MGGGVNNGEDSEGGGVKTVWGGVKIEDSVGGGVTDSGGRRRGRMVKTGLEPGGGGGGVMNGEDRMERG